MRGRLARTVESGGWTIAGESRKFLILNPRAFQDETWFRVGTDVEATGVLRPGTVTIYQEGTPFEVRTMRPLRAGAGGTNAGDANVETGGAALTRVVVTGEATVQAQPDTAIITLAVVTQNASASEAQAENASKTEAVVRAARASAGAGAEVKTSGYSVQPQYVYKEGQPPQITSYLVRNGVTVTTGELNRVGAVIDAASRAGANSVDNLQFTLRRDRPARAQALTEATQEALAQAEAVAQALGGRLVRIVEVQEGGGARPPIIYARQQESFAKGASADAAQTPIEPGTLDIRSQVQLVVEITTRR